MSICCVPDLEHAPPGGFVTGRACSSLIPEPSCQIKCRFPLPHCAGGRKETPINTKTTPSSPKKHVCFVRNGFFPSPGAALFRSLRFLYLFFFLKTGEHSGRKRDKKEPVSKEVGVVFIFFPFVRRAQVFQPQFQRLNIAVPPSS